MSSNFNFQCFPEKFSVSRYFQPAIYTVFHAESEFAAQNIQILQPDEKIQVSKFEKFRKIGKKSAQLWATDRKKTVKTFKNLKTQLFEGLGNGGKVLGFGHIETYTTLYEKLIKTGVKRIRIYQSL